MLKDIVSVHVSCDHCLHAGGGRAVAPTKARQPALEESEDDEEEAAAQPAGNPTLHLCLLSLDALHFIVELHAHCLVHVDIHTLKSFTWAVVRNMCRLPV